MYVCICNAVTDKQIKEAAEGGATSMKHLREQLNVGTCCGRCATCAKQILKDARTQPCSNDNPIMHLAGTLA